jgi:hypothetical protein
MTAIVLTTPRRNGSKQIIGRILRRGSDESIIREIVDIVDMRCNLHSQYYDRKKIYIEKGYDITTIKISTDLNSNDLNSNDLNSNDLNSNDLNSNDLNSNDLNSNDLNLNELLSMIYND